MSSKQGNKHYYKGKGCNSIGYVSRKGRFVVDPYKVVHFVVPNLADCKLQPYVSYKSPKQTTRPMDASELLGAVATDAKLKTETASEEPSAQDAEASSPGGFFSSFFKKS